MVRKRTAGLGSRYLRLQALECGSRPPIAAAMHLWMTISRDGGEHWSSLRGSDAHGKEGCGRVFRGQALGQWIRAFQAKRIPWKTIESWIPVTSQSCKRETKASVIYSDKNVELPGAAVRKNDVQPRDLKYRAAEPLDGTIPSEPLVSTPPSGYTPVPTAGTAAEHSGGRGKATSFRAVPL